jgi:hypothetical protein
MSNSQPSRSDSPLEGQSGGRLPDGEHRYHEAPNGSFWRDETGEWRVKTPNGMGGTLALGVHTVTEHDDGTITVQPSILTQWPNASPPREWHGWLERGVWREV